MLKCTKCQEEKEEDGFEFRKDRQCYRTVCKDCKNARSKIKYLAIADALSERRKQLREPIKDERNRAARRRYWNKRDEFLEKAKARESYGKWDAKKANEWRQKNKHKPRAHQAVFRAMKDGKLIRPEVCQWCGRKCKPHAHHPNYERPLDVVWVCSGCHRKIHSKFFNEMQ